MQSETGWFWTPVPSFIGYVTSLPKSIFSLCGRGRQKYRPESCGVKFDYLIKQELVNFPWKESDIVWVFVGPKSGIFNSAVKVKKAAIGDI